MAMCLLDDLQILFGCIVLIFLCVMTYRFQRPSGPIPSSMLGLEVAIDDFGFEDYLNGNYPLLSYCNFLNMLHSLL